MDRARIGTKGQVVIPVRIRKIFHLEPGTEVVFDENGQDLSIKPVTAQSIDALLGKYAGRGRSKTPLTELLVRERRSDLEIEERKYAQFLKRK